VASRFAPPLALCGVAVIMNSGSTNAVSMAALRRSRLAIPALLTVPALTVPEVPAVTG
jgi:hypothetical protein